MPGGLVGVQHSKPASVPISPHICPGLHLVVIDPSIPASTVPQIMLQSGGGPASGNVTSVPASIGVEPFTEPPHPITTGRKSPAARMGSGYADAHDGPIHTTPDAGVAQVEQRRPFVGIVLQSRHEHATGTDPGQLARRHGCDHRAWPGEGGDPGIGRVLRTGAPSVRGARAGSGALIG